jgi:Ca2+-binding RTX toxin-like protein
MEQYQILSLSLGFVCMAVIFAVRAVATPGVLDAMLGGAGDDVLVGGPGQDVLDGGPRTTSTTGNAAYVASALGRVRGRG